MEPLAIVTCPTWGARQPKAPITTVGKAQRIIVHHTAGHHREIALPANESYAEAVRYARDIQNYHMDTNDWIDSGHNFLVCRNGLVLQGRWHTVTAIEAGHMVDSAHCPGQNHQIGIEHEHLGAEPMTDKQRNASAQLIAWISFQYRLAHALPLFPHSEFFATACPANLKVELPHLKELANRLLTGDV